MPRKPFNFAMLSHSGLVRKANQDLCAATPQHGVFVLCDGMGGAAAGEIASSLAAHTFLEALAPQAANHGDSPEARLANGVSAANRAVYQKAQGEPDKRGMGTTLVALLLQPASPASAPPLHLAHVGDSRCYLFRAGVLSQLTADHSLVEEQLRRGDITAAQAEVHPMRNVITRSIGTQASVEPDITRLDPQPGDLYLLASDGLTRELGHAEVAQTFTRFTTGKEPVERHLLTLCQTLIDQANEAGGGDNISVLILHLP